MRVLLLAMLSTFSVSAASPSKLPILKVQAMRLLFSSKYKAGDEVRDGSTLIGTPSFKKWTAGGKSTYLLAYVNQDTPGDYVLEVGEFKESEGKLQLIAKGQESDLDMSLDPGNPAGAELDLAPYRLKDDEIAFGVRFEYDFDSSSTYCGGETLYLFLNRNATSKAIFHAETDSSCEDKNSGQSDNKTGPKTLIVISKHATRGYHDLIVKRGKASTTYVWNGSSYIRKK